MKKTLSFILVAVLFFSCLALPSFAAVGDAVPFENSDFFELGDYNIHYRTYGDPQFNRGKVILLHGFGLSSACFEELAALYENEGYCVVTPDFPNFGYSSRETSDTELVSREDLIFALMQSLGDKWIVGGHSMGGGVAVNIAVDHPEAVTALVLFAPQTSTESTGVVSAFMKSRVMQLLFGGIISLAGCFPKLVSPLVAVSFSSLCYARDYDVSKIAAPLSLKGTGAGMAVMSSHTRGCDFEKFSSLEIPVVIVTAKNDLVAIKSNLNALIAAAPKNTTLETVEKGGHMMMEYDPKNAAALTLPVMALA